MGVMDATVHECDVLVIGGGLAGCYAAIRAKDFTDKVLLVDKAKVSRSGSSTFAAGVMLCPSPEDDLDAWTKEIVERGEYMNDQDWVRLMLEEQIKRIKEMESWGAPFERDGKGNIVRIIGRGHVNTRILMFHGKHFMETMRKEVLKRDIGLIERISITDLLTSDAKHPTNGRVVGAVGFDPRSGQPHVFKARATVMATGGVGFINVGAIDNITSDGIAQSFRAGAEVTGLEFLSNRGHWCWDRKYVVPGMNMFQNAGLIITNAKGERFMEKYCPELKERARLQDLDLAFSKEDFEGRGPIYADMRHFSSETIERFRRVLPVVMRTFDNAGIDLQKHKLVFELARGVLRAFGGGIRNNTFCETSLGGLYVAGQDGGFPAHGTYSIGGVNLAMCCVSGHRAGEFAVKYAGQNWDVQLDENQVASLQEVAFRPLQRRDGETAETIGERLQDVVSRPENTAFRHEKRLRKVLVELQSIRALIPQLSAADPHELVKANAVRNYLDCVELIYTASLIRQESRGSLVREDYPYRDDINWLKWVVLSKNGAGTQIRTVPIPIYRYPVKPDRYEKVSLSIALPKIDTN